MVALVGVLNGLGVVTVTFTIARLPGILADAGYSPLDAGRYAHWVAAGFCFFSAYASLLPEKTKIGSPARFSLTR